MGRIAFVFVLFSASCIFLISGCGDAGGKRYPDYRYRLTVEVDTPEGVKTGSSVIEVQTAVAGKYTIPVPGHVHHRVRGEGVEVDLGKRGTMFALLRSEYSVDWASRALQSVTKPVTYEESKAAGLTSDYSPSFDITMQRTLALNGKYDLPRYVDNMMTSATVRNKGGELPSGYPMLVTFKSLNDPASVIAVDSDDLAATFGAGVKIKRITVERTTDAVTTGIEKRLGWLRTQQGSIVKYPNNTPIGEKPLEHRINEGDGQQVFNTVAHFAS